MIGVPPLRLRHPEKGANGKSRNEFALVTDSFFHINTSVQLVFCTAVSAVPHMESN